jgi:uncharacterized protein (TIGR00269 family)
MRQHKLALCKDHYLEWFINQTERMIEKYKLLSRDKRILVAVSGGKDSLALWDVLRRLNYAVDGLYISLGIDGGTSYSDKSRRFCEEFAKNNELNLHIIVVDKVFNNSVPELAKWSRRGKGKPCSVCGLTKRHIMNQMAINENYDALVTGHNLDDEAATLFGNTLNWSTGYLQRQYPLLKSTHPGLVRKAKPFCRFYERETAAYALLREIKYIYDECPHSIGAKSIYYKELLNQMEQNRPGTKLSFYLSFLKARENGFFSQTEETNKPSLNTCPACNGPTTVPGECAFCRLIARVYKEQKAAKLKH